MVLKATVQKQRPKQSIPKGNFRSILQTRFSYKFRNMKTLLLESLFNKDADQKADNFIEKRL